MPLKQGLRKLKQIKEVVNVKQSQLIEEVTQIATLKAIEVFNDQKEQAIQKEQSKRLHNTKLLLKNYQEFKIYVEKIDDKVKVSVPRVLVSEGKNLIDLITFGEDIISSIKETSKRTIAMVQYIDKALDTLEYMYKQEDNTRYFNILKKRYVDGQTISYLAEYYHMNDRSIYKALESATERLSILLFGVYGIKVE
ncbi:MAG: hypothetical protein M3Z34_08145 [Staphylococcus epidermidis]|nr:hypothetical protein [Staphylococcus epidermidis]